MMISSSMCLESLSAPCLHAFQDRIFLPNKAHTADFGILSHSGSDNDGNGDAYSQWRDVEEVAGDDAEVEDGVVNPAHTIHIVLLVVQEPCGTVVGVDVLQSSALGACWRRRRWWSLLVLDGSNMSERSMATSALARRAMANDGLEWYVNSYVVGRHVDAVVAGQGLKALTRKAIGVCRFWRSRGMNRHL